MRAARAVLSLLLGLVLALLLAGAVQFLLLPFVGTAGANKIQVVGAIVFWGVLVLVVVTIVRGLRREQRSDPD